MSKLPLPVAIVPGAAAGSRVKNEGYQEVLGAAVQKRLQANAALVGEAVLNKGLATLTPELRHELETLSPIGWIALGKVELAQDAISRAAGKDPEAFHDEVIRRSVDDALSTLYRVVLRFVSDEALVARTPAMFRRTRRLGRLISKIDTPGRAFLELSDWPGIEDRHIRQVGIGVERVLVLTGRREVALGHKRRDDGATLWARWRAA